MIKLPTLKTLLLVVCSMPAIAMAQSDEVVLLDAPVKVTASLHVLDEGGYNAQIGVHSGPVAQLVNTVISASSRNSAERTLRQQIEWRAPYLFVHSSCGAGNTLRCEGEVVFKISGSKVTRLGDFIGSASGIYRNGHFYDAYDKLGEQPEFVIVLDPTDDTLTVNAAATWSNNAADWQRRAEQIANAHPGRDWSEAEWEYYFSALLGNAALARYCNQTDELQLLLNLVNPSLDVDHRRLLTDSLSKVIPLEKPKAWRTPF